MAPKKIETVTTFDITKPIALVDLSSFIFYRFFAIQRWLSVSGNESKLSPEEVLAKFEKLFENNLTDIKKKLKVNLPNVILAKDCPRNEIWRNNTYADYKSGRDASRPSNFDPSIFAHSYNTLVPKLQATYGFQLMQYEAAEGDDIIAILHNFYRKKAPETKIYILSIDTDFLQLVSSFTDVYNFTFKSLSASMDKDKLENYLEWKIIRGDSSDNISAIDKKIGDVTAMKLAKDPALLKAKLNSSSEVLAAYERNKILINFDYIPLNIREGILSLVS